MSASSSPSPSHVMYPFVGGGRHSGFLEGRISKKKFSVWQKFEALLFEKTIWYP
jgi:hypothetical protein